MGQIFRKSLLDKLSSPEQLDKMIVITPPSFWIALSGAGIIILAATVWGFFGTLPVNVNANGIYVNEQGTQSVYSEVAGVISEVLVEDGEQVKKGDIIAVFNTDDADEKIADYEERIRKVESVTLDSAADVVTADNKSLIDVKNQMITVDQTLKQNQSLLELRIDQLAEGKEKLARSEAAYLSAELSYFNSIYVENNTAEQLRYTDAQSAYSAAGNYLESANSSLSQAQASYAQAQAQYSQLENKYTVFLASEQALQEDYTNKAEEAKRTLAEAGYLGELAADISIDFNDPAQFGQVPTAEQQEAVNTAFSGYTTAYQRLQEFQTTNAGVRENYEKSLLELRQTMNTADSNRSSAQKIAHEYTQQKEQAKTQYDEAKEAYIAKTDRVNAAQQEQSVLGSKYNRALNEYSTDQSTVRNLEDTISQLEVQIQAERQNVENQIYVISNQFYATKDSLIDQLKKELDSYIRQKEQSQVKATVDGQISNLSVSVGSIINQGTEVAKIQMGEAEDNVIVCYVPVSSGKKVREGMEVLIYPSTVNKQEYGHMEAKVIRVDSYVTSTGDMQKQLGDDKLVEAFLSEGPVVEVVCSLRTSDETASGYYWSSKKGAKLQIEQGTMVEADVVLERKAPITMLIPYIKDKLTVKTEKE